MRILYFVCLLLAATPALATEKKAGVFGEIIAGRLPAGIISRDADVVAFLANAPHRQ